MGELGPSRERVGGEGRRRGGCEWRRREVKVEIGGPSISFGG